MRGATVSLSRAAQEIVPPPRGEDWSCNCVSILIHATKHAPKTQAIAEWLKHLDREDRREIGADILAVQKGWPLGLPLCRSLGQGLWEVRSTLPSRRIARVIFAFDDDTIVLLHGFIKKTQKTPPAEIDTALKRWKEMTS
jgi:phage-related protein